MPVLESQIDINSDEFRKNREKMLAAIAEFRDAEAIVQAATEKSRARFQKRKQLMPRERIALLLDRGAPFLELMPLAAPAAAPFQASAMSRACAASCRPRTAPSRVAPSRHPVSARASACSRS